MKAMEQQFNPEQLEDLTEAKRLEARKKFESASASVQMVAEALLDDTDYAALIPEDIFKARFLPLFRMIFKPSALTDEELDLRDTLWSEWLGITHDGYHPAFIVDSTGNKLFKIPAMMQTDLIRVIRSADAPSFSEIARVAELHTRLSPIRAEKIRSAALESKAQEIMGNQRQLMRSFDCFKQMHVRYGLATEVPKENSPTGTPSGNDDELIFD